MMLLTQVLLMQCHMLTEVELNWQYGGNCINLYVFVGKKVGINLSTEFFKSHK